MAQLVKDISFNPDKPYDSEDPAYFFDRDDGQNCVVADLETNLEVYYKIESGKIVEYNATSSDIPTPNKVIVTSIEFPNNYTNAS
ncbi:hypothetical protein [Microseira wollei]|uniref:Uncharacterized protein n=1 Tax=Microseira wollei NIES-4236 TaxID=2530354 RepID=A0AAV3XDB4_9CYAN|nr:hypothetical protein [Microseira wollei]GET40233.1 hypothetical protein MiSe_50420 [Microseira wollei NIES-4236]